MFQNNWRVPAKSRETYMTTLWNENSSRVTVPLQGESTGHRWIPLTKGQERGLWLFLWC